MFIEKIKSEGLAHLSYLVGSRGSAAVIDPRRDAGVYIEEAKRRGAGIKFIFETHRHEDFVSGSLELAGRTGARVLHGKALDFGYGEFISEGDRFELGMLEIRVLETPGHTYESVSLVVSDRETGSVPVGVFTGDALFAGDVGRTDFFPGKKKECAELLYRSIMEKILPLGDEILLFPAHGAGSLCGARMAAREFSTLGIERKNNPLLRKTMEDFIRHKISESHYYPPYFRKMEEYNKKGAPAADDSHLPPFLAPREFSGLLKRGVPAVDVRSPEAYAGLHVPGALSIPLDMLPSFAGWFIPDGTEPGIIAERESDIDLAARYLMRLGRGRISAVLGGGVHAWEAAGEAYESMPAVHVDVLRERIASREKFTLLDVRTREEFERGHLPGALNMFLGELPGNLDSVPEARPLTVFCGSGRRAVIAASILRRKGFDRVETCFGSMAACMETSCGELAE